MRIKNVLKLNNNKTFNDCENDNAKLRKKVKMLLTIKETAEVLKISVSTLYKWIHERKIEYVKIGSRVLFTDEILNNYIKKNTISIE